jgi:hypothetical protein
MRTIIVVKRDNERDARIALGKRFPYGVFRLDKIEQTESGKFAFTFTAVGYKAKG